MTVTWGTKANPQAGTEVDFTNDPTKTMEPGKVYAGLFSVTGLLAGDEQTVIDKVTDAIQYPSGHPEYNGWCIPTYIQADSGSGIAYAEWIVSNQNAITGMSFYDMPSGVPLLLAFVIVAAVIAILIWLSSILLTRATEFVGGGPAPDYITIAIAIGASAALLVAAVYAYKNIVSDKPLITKKGSTRGQKSL